MSINPSAAPAQDPAAARTASSPFDNPDGDLIIRSSDRVDFYVYKVIMSEASPVFKTMLSLPQPSRASVIVQPLDTTPHTAPVVDLSEPSETVDKLLRFCYPCPNPSFQSLQEVMDVLRVAQKYDVEGATQSGRDAIITFRDVDPVGAYAIGCYFGFVDETKAAARRALRLHRDKLGRSTPLLSIMTAWDYERLLTYHRKVGERAAKFASTADWLDVTEIRNCITNTSDCKDYREQVAVILDKTPAGEVLTEENLVYAGMPSGARSAWLFWRYVTLLSNQVATAADKIELEIG